MPAKMVGKKVVIMAEKGEGGEGLCGVWTLEKHFPRLMKHFCMNSTSEVSARMWYRDVCINLGHTCVYWHPYSDFFLIFSSFPFPLMLVPCTCFSFFLKLKPTIKALRTF